VIAGFPIFNSSAVDRKPIISATTYILRFYRLLYLIKYGLLSLFYDVGLVILAPGEPKNKPLPGRLDVAFTFSWFWLVIGEAMKFEGPTTTACGGELMVLLFTTGAFVDCSLGIGDRRGMHDELFGFVLQSTSGDDRDDVDWPLDRSGRHDGSFGFVLQSTTGGDRDDVDWPGDDVDASKVSQWKLKH
jgi:hypothetical protein